jgi:hypothetical protein
MLLSEAGLRVSPHILVVRERRRPRRSRASQPRAIMRNQLTKARWRFDLKPSRFEVWNLAPAAMSPAPAAAATSAAAAAPAATPATTTTATATTATAAPPGYLFEAGDALLPVEQVERRETDVRHLLIVENHVVFGPVVVGLRDIGGGQCRRGCVSSQRKPQSDGTQRGRGSGLGRAVPSPSLFHPCHGRFPRYVTLLGSSRCSGYARTQYECEAALPVPWPENLFFDAA